MILSNLTTLLRPVSTAATVRMRRLVSKTVPTLNSVTSCGLCCGNDTETCLCCLQEKHLQFLGGVLYSGSAMISVHRGFTNSFNA